MWHKSGDPSVLESHEHLDGHSDEDEVYGLQ